MKPNALKGFLLCILVSWNVLGSQAAAIDNVRLVLIDSDMREDWPDPGVVGFRRDGTTGDLSVKFTFGGTAIAGTEYVPSAEGTLIIPDGDREAWLELSPANQVLGVASKNIVVNLQPDPAYSISSQLAEASVTLTIENVSALPNAKAAARFLMQAAFGPDGNGANLKEVMKKGYAVWVADQFKRPVGLHQPIVQSLRATHKGQVLSEDKVTAWWARAMSRSATADPLRQRVAFALSEILVISDRLEDLEQAPVGMANYYDVLLKGAFGNYRDLLYKVGTHPCMGVYLNHLQNEKPDPDAGTFADENFAREIMQLFSIGIWELNADGTRKLDINGQPIPTYDNTTIANMARVMTGFSWGGPRGTDFWDARENYTAPMRMWDAYHDCDPKVLLNGVTLPQRTPSDPDLGTAGMADFNAAIDCLFNHPNTGPFLSKQLIQKLVTSNPSPAYVGRVAAKFANNGQGVRGDMKAVITAILLDDEARNPRQAANLTSGKLKEPYLRTVNFARAVNARAANGRFPMAYLGDVHFQEPLSAPSVFNFFKPGYSLAGPISENALVSPEFEILNDITALAMPNYYMSALENGFNAWGSENRAALILPHLTTELALAGDVPALLRRLDLLLTGGTLAKEQHQVIREAVEQINTDFWQWRQERVRLAIYLITSTPEAAVLQ